MKKVHNEYNTHAVAQRSKGDNCLKIHNGSVNGLFPLLLNLQVPASTPTTPPGLYFANDRTFQHPNDSTEHRETNLLFWVNAFEVSVAFSSEEWTDTHC